MPDPRFQILLLSPVLALAAFAVWTGSKSSSAADTQAPPAQATPPAAEDDPAVQHLRMLERMDAEINAQATRAHLEARKLLEEVLPVPYLGVDATPDAGGMKIDHVYPYSGAEAAGLQEGDVLLRLDQSATDSKTALARAVRSHRTGQTVELALTRAGKPLSLRARIGGRPEEDEDEEEQFPDLPLARPVSPACSFDFEDTAAGLLPTRLASILGGHGNLGAWTVALEGTQHFLRQSEDDHTGMRFPMAIVKDLDMPDAVARVRFRYSGGRADRAAGLVLRYRDPGNYLVARANAQEADLRIFRVVNGLRTTLPGAIAACPTNDDRWHTLEFRCEGPRVSATLDDKATASSYDTFFRRGAAGLWTKSDSQTDFDDAHFEPIAPPASAPTNTRR